MLLTLKQVAGKLKISESTVDTLRKQKVLIDVGKTDPGRIRHQFLFDAKQVAEVGKHLVRVGRTYRYMPETNAHAVAATKRPTSIRARVSEAPITPTAAPAPIRLLSSLNERLESLEAKVDRLLALWS
jgi:hypothetical protein